MAEAHKGPNAHGAAAAFGICDSHNARYVNQNGRLYGKVCHFSRPGPVRTAVGRMALERNGIRMAELLMKSAIREPTYPPTAQLIWDIT